MNNSRHLLKLVKNIDIEQIADGLLNNINVLSYITRKFCNPPSPSSTKVTNVDSGTTATFLEELYNAWLKDPKSVHPSWDLYFKSLPSDTGIKKVLEVVKDSGLSIPTLPSIQTLTAPPPPPSVPTPILHSAVTTGGSGGGSGSLPEKLIEEYSQVYSLIRRYQVRGHFLSKLDPLDISDNYRYRLYSSDRIPDVENFSKEALAKEYVVPHILFIGKEKKMKLEEIIRRLKEAYCKYIGIEYHHIHDLDKVDFIRQKFEPPGAVQLTKEERILALKRLTKAHGLEEFLQKKWSSEKRFGLEGCESMIPCLQACLDKANELGVDHVVIGLAHRGRLNLLANVCKKPLYQMFTQFYGVEPEEEGSGDVKYHMGSTIEFINRVTKKPLKISLIANPSHLEVSDPIVKGKTKAEQFYRGDTGGNKVMSVIIHGDAAFSGQGVVYETFNLSYLDNYTNHGTIHIVINNQIGFTTDPRFARSQIYCTEVAKVVQSPVFHVNADEPDSVVYVGKVAAEYRQKFHRDVVIDLVGYRRNGHNETDEPMFTQPLMYQTIKKIEPIMFKYGKRLVKENVITEPEWTKMRDEYRQLCETHFEKAKKETTMKMKDWLETPWDHYKIDKDGLKISPTGVPEDIIKTVLTKFSSKPPDNFIVHPGIERILNNRKKLMDSRMMDWSMGEAVAFASLLKDGIHVRISGEDVERGTFSHRHHVLHHQTKDMVTYNSLQHMFPNQAVFSTCNSSLTELGIVGFELGYSLVNPNSLVIWEAQFGDFSNMAQTTIDNQLCCGESKWMRQTGLVLYLPHAFEGAGPEHSSARIERYLQLSADDESVFPPEDPDFVVKQLQNTNWIVANLTTPGNLFHILRRQIAMPFRKPLVIFTPKSLLKSAAARSSFDEILPGTEFKRIIPENGPALKNKDTIKKLIFCSGHVYYDIVKARADKKLDDQIAITRIEQYTPFPFDLVKKECATYPNANIFWAQEEHKNAGPWHYIHERISTSIGHSKKVHYIGRAVSAASASGNKMQFKKEFETLMADAVKL